MRRTAVLNVVGLTEALLDRGMPRLAAWAASGRRTPIRSALPAVTCTAQADYLTGTRPEEHGVVANGWYFRDDAEIRFWRQSNRLVRAPKVWDRLRAEDPSFTCANLFWWFNMYSSADVSATPRPMYPADGRKIPDIHTRPAALREDLQRELGRFPLFNFWGPTADLRSSRWIAGAARRVEERFAPTLSLVYLPHLDYNLQRLGPDDPALVRDLHELDGLVVDLIEFLQARGVAVLVVSEYGVTAVSTPIPVNRALREVGLVAVREELGRELLDAGASEAFAVCDHQVAHVYVRDRADLPRARRVLERLDGVERILDETGKREAGLAHPRAGELVAIARSDAWFCYPYWLDDARAPDFARTVDIHRKPGFDPVELFVDPRLPLPALSIGWRLLKKAAGFRCLMDVIPLTPGLVRGSHGRPVDDPRRGPLALAADSSLLPAGALPSTGVHDVIAAAVRAAPL